MRGLQIVDGYSSALTLRETQKAIKLVKDTFANELAAALNLERVSAPFIVKKGSGITIATMFIQFSLTSGTGNVLSPRKKETLNFSKIS